MNFAYSYLLFTPLLYALLHYLRNSKKHAVNYANINLLKELKPTWRMRLRGPILFMLSSLTLIALSIAAARPQRISTLNLPEESRNIIIAIDVSRSMGTEDFDTRKGAISRLSGVKQVLQDFIAARPSERIGLVVFGSSAFLQAPLTLDHDLLVELVKRLDVGIAGDGTAIGDGLGLSLKRIEALPAKSKTVVLLTDGVSNSGQVSPLQAANAAKDLGIKVHTIGIGSDKPILKQAPGLLGSHTVKEVEFDEATLKEMAKLSGGVYFNAANIDKLQEVYEEIDKLERSADKAQSKKIVDELFWPYALCACLLYLAYLTLNNTIFMTIP